MGVTSLILSLVLIGLSIYLPLQILRYSKGQVNWITAEGLQ